MQRERRLEVAMAIVLAGAPTEEVNLSRTGESEAGHSAAWLRAVSAEAALETDVGTAPAVAEVIGQADVIYMEPVVQAEPDEAATPARSSPAPANAAAAAAIRPTSSLKDTLRA